MIVPVKPSHYLIINKLTVTRYKNTGALPNIRHFIR